MARLDEGSVSDVACGSDMPAIEARGLSFAYPGAAAPVLEGLDWSVPQGAFALLVGGTGSGKSTLLSLLKPEIAPAGELAGELCVLGENVADMDVRASAERVGYVFQDPENQIVCETVWHEMAFGLENLGVSRDEMRRRVAETSYFFGMEDWLHRDTDTLSGGRKQLLSLAAVLALRPRVLLLDEPTSQLDPVAEKNFLHALFRVNRELGCTVVVATHQPRPMLEYATCAYRIEGGRVREVADLASLGGREGLLALGSYEPAQGEAPGAAAIREGWFRYDRASGWVLRGLDVAFSAGAVHAIVGGNGCGKSTIIATMAHAASLLGLRAAVLDLDLMFGNLYDLLGADSPRDMAALIEPSAAGALVEPDVVAASMRVAPGVTLWGPVAAPEQAELMARPVELLLDILRRESDVVFVDTSVFWGDAVAAAVAASDRCLIVGDAAVSSATSASRVIELAGRVGVPRTRMSAVFNRFGARGADEDVAMRFEIACALSSKIRIADGGQDLAALMAFGRADEAVGQTSAFATSVREATREMLVELGCAVGPWSDMVADRATRTERPRIRLPWSREGDPR